MTNPFKQGDVVYHYKLGKCYVKNLRHPQIIIVRACDENKIEIYVEIDDLSYEPWPAPVHVKPFQKGWWAYTFDNGSPRLGQFNNDPTDEEVNLIKFLSDDPNFLEVKT